MAEHVNRRDYAGRDMLTEGERQFIESFIDRGYIEYNLIFIHNDFDNCIILLAIFFILGFHSCLTCLNREHVWANNGLLAVNGVGILDLLFDRAICSDVINAFLDILQSDRYRAMHSINNEFGYLNVHTMVSMLNLVIFNVLNMC